MTPFEIFLSQAELFVKSGDVKSIDIGNTLGRDLSIKRLLKIDGNTGRFMGIVVNVVPDITAHYNT